MNRLLVIAVVAATCVACPAPHSADAYCQQQMERQCQFWYRCCNTIERSRFGFQATLLHTNEEECREELPKWICGTSAPHSEAVAEGRASWNGARAQECQANLDDAIKGCAAEQYGKGTGAECTMNGLLQGEVASGGDCYLDAECSDESAACIVPESDDPGHLLMTAKGTCEKLPGDGETCTNNRCAEDHACISDTCQRLRAGGETCNYDFECLSDYCEQTGATDGTCANLFSSWESCWYDRQCASGECDDMTYTCTLGSASADIEYDICTGGDR